MATKVQAKAKVRNPRNKREQDVSTKVARRIALWRKKRKARHPVEVEAGCKTEALDLRNFGLRSLPPEIRNLEGLEALNLTQNKLQEVPEWVGELRSLRVLGFGNNQLRSIPAAVASLPFLQTMFLQDNKLETLPISLLRKPLKTLEVKGNPLKNVPESMRTRGGQALVDYLRRILLEESSPLGELKLLVVGRGGAGKTTLVRRLAGEMPKEDEPETHSIAIREFSIPSKKGDVRTRAWDFGGQEILHSTHQFFLTERSLYLVVLEPRSGLAQRDAEYWLKLVEVQGRGSPTIVVMNWSRGRPWKVDQIRLKREFPFIVDLIL
jgi:internalin A